MFSRTSIGYDEARALLDGLLEDAAAAAGKPVAVAVVDDRGDLVAFGRMDGTPVRCLRIAINKAYTAARVGEATAVLASRLADAHRDAGIYNDRRINLLPGGVPVHDSAGSTIGGIGVSGRLPEDDDALVARWRSHFRLSE
ncbi:MAG: GlcG/HbpS family heme-binding protein [Chloroflexota bacterium]